MRKFVAKCWVEGMSNEDIGLACKEKFNLESAPVEKTVRNWRAGDTKLQNMIHSETRERVVRIARRTDTAIEALDFSDLSPKELLEIRKEYMPDLRVLTDETEDAGKVAEDVFGAAEEDPELAKKIAESAIRQAAEDGEE